MSLSVVAKGIWRSSKEDNKELSDAYQDDLSNIMATTMEKKNKDMSAIINVKIVRRNRR